MDGRDEKVRLIGINTPETVDPRRPVECFGKEASNYMKEIAQGKIVRLEYDESQSSRDTYGRILAYVYLEDGEMINRKMVAEGYAYEYTYMTPYRYQKDFRNLQRLAQTSKRGLWADTTCAGSKQFPN
jgi:micrococcal nuclease